MYINLLIKIKNARKAEIHTVKTPFTKFDHAISEALQRHGYLDKVEVKGKNPKRYIEVELSSKKMMKEVKFLSRPGTRVYIGYRDLEKVKGGYGLLVVSTSKGVMSAEEAKHAKLGGQKLFKLW